MGHKFQKWQTQSLTRPSSLDDLKEIIFANRRFDPVGRLEYGDYGLHDVLDVIHQALQEGKKIALYADYDVDGTMSCVSWIWFFHAVGYKNFTHYIPCRFREGYGVNMDAMKHLIHAKQADVIITMDTGITANAEASYCKSQGVTFICTDHHKIQPDKMPDCLILNPKMHPDLAYQELCGAGVTFVLLRKLAKHLGLSPNHAVWTDILALAGMATICDVVPLNGVNHQLAKMGVSALMRSQRPVLQKLRESASIKELRDGGVGDEKDVGFRLGPRINAVGRLEHADAVVAAFVEEDPTELIELMEVCNERRKKIQEGIVKEALALASAYEESPILFLGGDWHPGVVGIAASKLAEQFWKPTWLFERKNGICKGSARSIPGFDVTDAMGSCPELFLKFGGHRAAGGFSFAQENEAAICEKLNQFALRLKESSPEMWNSVATFDCELDESLATLELTDVISEMKPFGHGFEEPRFVIDSVVEEIQFYKDKVTGLPKHSAVTLKLNKRPIKVMYFNHVAESLSAKAKGRFLVTAQRNSFRNNVSLQFMGIDYEALS